MTGSTIRTVVGLGLILSPLAPDESKAQRPPETLTGKDTVVTAHAGYKAGSLHRFLFGDNYRDLWATPIRAPLLDLRAYAGGLTAFKTGGGLATKSLRLLGPDSSQYVFRPVFKGVVDLPNEFRHTIIWKLFVDARSAIHPTAPLSASAPLDAVHILHPRPRLFVMPDDPRLGEFRSEFAGKLGTLEEFPHVPDKGIAFAGAVKIISDDDLLLRINKDRREQIDARTFLTAHFIDMMLGDTDRHSGQWKWARLKHDAEWVPIPRDRDWVFISYEGIVPRLMRKVSPSVVYFDSTFSPVGARFHNALEFDRRLLAGLEKPVWDSIAAYVAGKITNPVLAASVSAMPPEYAASSAVILAKLETRRNHLREAAAEYYHYLAKIVDLHATDTADRATVVRSGDGFVDVRIQVGNSAPWFNRRFDARETEEIRLYLHDGDDTAVVTGSVRNSIPVRIIGGNGNNTLIDSSTVGGHHNPTYIYDAGRVTGVIYESDSLIKLKAERGSDDLPFNRRPWVRLYRKVRPPGPDRESTFKPVAGLGSGHGLGLVPRIGLARYNYGFRRFPYSSMMKGEVAYSTTNRLETIASVDKRFESSSLHLPVTAAMSQLGVVEFRGLGNDVANPGGRFDDVRQRQWSLHPAVGLSFGPESDVSIGPIIRYTTTDSVANRFISQERPYGFDHFAQAGLRLDLRLDTRNELDTARRRGGGFVVNPPADPPLWGTVNASASVYPSIWDAKSAYEDLSAGAAAYLTLPVLTRPVLALRGGGKKLFGDFPYFDAAFVGGSQSLRTENRQRYAGDAMIHGTTELRVPIAKFPLILPLDVGALAFVEVGRVYVDGESPGGWHKGAGAGFWVGVIRPETGINVVITNNPDRRVLTNLGFVF